MAEDYFNYFTEVEEHFQRARGTPRVLSPRDWDLIDKWKNAGIPLEAVLRGIDTAFEKLRRDPAKARTQMVNSLAYCKQAVAVEVQRMAAAAPIGLKEAGPSFSLDDVRNFVAHRAGVLREAGHPDFGDLLEALDLDALYLDLEQFERRLTGIEEALIA